MDSNGLRLGEAPDSQYEEVEVSLSSGDRLVFYTDGITELVGPDGKYWGERKFLKTLLDGFNSDADINHVSSNLLNEINNHRDGHPLEDDVTFFMTEIK